LGSWGRYAGLLDRFWVEIRTVIVKTKVLHDLKKLLHKDCSIKFRLRENLEEILDLKVLEVVDVQRLDAFKQAHR